MLAQGVQFRQDGALGRQGRIGIALLRDQLSAHFCCGDPGVQALGPKLGIGLALAIDQRFDVIQQLR